MPESVAISSPLREALVEIYTEHHQQMTAHAVAARSEESKEQRRKYLDQAQNHAQRAAAANFLVMTYDKAAHIKDLQHSDQNTDEAGRDALMEMAQRLSKTRSGNPLSQLSKDEKAKLEWSLVDEVQPIRGRDEIVEPFEEALSRRSAVKKFAAAGAALLVGAGYGFHRASEAKTAGQAMPIASADLDEMRAIHAQETALLNQPTAWSTANVENSLRELETLSEQKTELRKKIIGERMRNSQSWFTVGTFGFLGSMASLVTALSNYKWGDKATIEALKPQLDETVNAIAEMVKMLPPEQSASRA